MDISLGKRLKVGRLFQYGDPSISVTTRFVADRAFEAIADPPVLSSSYLAASPAQQRALWAGIGAPRFNGRRGRDGDWELPAFFQNLLPEGVFRDHIAELRKCSPKDHFEILAACGSDLPGNVYASPVPPTYLDEDDVARYVTQQQDSLEVAVVAGPIEGAISLSGMQPKVGALQDGDRYVMRSKDQDGVHIIGKLPVPAYPLLPEVEHLSLQLARVAGVNVCQSSLAPLATLEIGHGYDLDDVASDTSFLAVVRFDRGVDGRVHCEDFAQVFGVMPEEKYSHPVASYLNVARFFMDQPTLGEDAVHELLRRIMVNQLIGNVDMHLKNIGLRYADGIHPELSPAYDIVAYSCYVRRYGHGLTLMGKEVSERASRREAEESGEASVPMLNTKAIRDFCAVLQIPERPAMKVVKDVVKLALARWPSMILESALSGDQKARLSQYLAARLDELRVKHTLI